MKPVRIALAEAEVAYRDEVKDMACACVGSVNGEPLCSCGMFHIDRLLEALANGGYLAHLEESAK